MASEYYKWLARDVKPEEKKELTPEEKRRNWWAYHKWYVVIAVVCVIFLADMVYDVVDNARNQPDYTIAYIGTAALPEDTVEALEAALAGLGEDLNGSGHVRVQIVEYVLAEGADPQSAYSHSMQLLMNIESVESVIFLLEDPEAFAANYPILTDTPMYHRWADCPVLTALELGTFEIPLLDGTAGGDNQKIMEHLFVARRGIWNDQDTEFTAGASRLFDTMTQGAE